MALKIVKEGVFDAKIYEESIGHDFRALSQAILPEIDDLCKLTSELHTEKGPFTTLKKPLNPQKSWFEAPNFLLNDCLPLPSNTPYSPPFLTPSSILTPSFGGKKPPFHDQKKVRFDLSRNR